MRTIGTGRRIGAGALATILLAVNGAPVAGQARKVPYWAAIAKDEARMRVGPSMDYPANWVYRRRNLPVRIVEVYPNWRRIEDPDGVKGWMHVRLLKDERTAIVRGGIAQVHRAASDGSTTLWRVESGVVGRVSDCDDDWCMLDLGGGRRGYMRRSNLWGSTDD